MRYPNGIILLHLPPRLEIIDGSRRSEAQTPFLAIHRFTCFPDIRILDLCGTLRGRAEQGEFCVTLITTEYYGLRTHFVNHWCHHTHTHLFGQSMVQIVQLLIASRLSLCMTNIFTEGKFNDNISIDMYLILQDLAHYLLWNFKLYWAETPR